MANEAAKKRVAKNREYMRRLVYLLLGVHALYGAYRVWYLWDSFSRAHMAGAALATTVHGVAYVMLRLAARAKYKPLVEGGALVDGGADLDQKGVLEYCWDMVYTTAFVQLSTAFVSDWFWLLMLVPPAIGVYFLWTMLIYPWISKPDPEKEDAMPLNRKDQRKEDRAAAKKQK